MDIFIPKNSDTGGKNTESWDTKDYLSGGTQKEQLKTMVEYFSALSKKTKELDDSIIAFSLFEKETKETVKKILSTTNNTQSLVFFGFSALVFVVIGIAYGYWEFVSSSTKNDDYKYNILNKIETQGYKIESLKECLLISKWLNPKCLD